MSKPLPLSPGKREELVKALLGAYPTRKRMNELLDFGLDKRPDDYPGPVSQAFRELVTDLNADDQITTLLVQAAKRSTNENLHAFHDEYFSLTSAKSRGEPFESHLTSLGFASLDDWLQRAAAIKAQVCCVEVVGHSTGTGFLIGPDLVITNYHVIKEVESIPRPNIRLHFDRTAPGKLGTTHTLAPVWLADRSPYSDSDLDGSAGPAASLDELDYAILRTSRSVGTEMLPHGQPRGWQTLLAEAPICSQGGPLVIVQHPEGEHMQIAIDTSSILNVSHTRVRYRTNTKHGSSGSPCFDLAWNLIALHHSGDQAFKPVWNEGIPIGVIASRSRSVTVDGPH